MWARANFYSNAFGNHVEPWSKTRKNEKREEQCGHIKQSVQHMKIS